MLRRCLEHRNTSFPQSTTPFACTLHKFDLFWGFPYHLRWGPLLTYFTVFRLLRLGSAPPPRTGNHRRVRKESHKSPPSWDPQSPERVRPGPLETQKSLKRVRKSGFRLLSDSFETPGHTLSGLWGPAWGGSSFQDFRTLPEFWARRAQQTLCRAGARRRRADPKPSRHGACVSPKRLEHPYRVTGNCFNRAIVVL